MPNIKQLLNDFMKEVEPKINKVYDDEEEQGKEGKSIKVYNEFSLQHELGIFLREKLPKYKVQFERNVKNFFRIEDTIKHEIDIVIYNKQKKERYAIELKFPLNGQYPEEMYSFIIDIKFMEQLKEHGFNATYTLTMVIDHNFYEGKTYDNSGNPRQGIYSYFRNKKIIEGEILKPTGNSDNSKSITLNRSHQIEWQENPNKDMKYYIVEIK